MKLYDNFRKCRLADTTSIMRTYTAIANGTDKLFVRFCCYKSTGFYAEVSNEFVLVRNKGDRYAEIAIPIKKYRKQLEKMLLNIIESRQIYDRMVMKDIKADMSNNALVISSQSSKVSIDLFHVARSLPIGLDKQSNYFLLTMIEGIKGWYCIIPLWNYHISKLPKNAIIVTDKQLRENIIPPVKHFNVGGIHLRTAYLFDKQDHTWCKDVS